jgi:hypothetical protein
MTSKQMFAIVENRWRISETMTFHRNAPYSLFARVARLKRVMIYLKIRTMRAN